MPNRRTSVHAIPFALALALLAGCGGKDDTVSQAVQQDEARGVPAPGLAETRAIAKEAYIYAFPMIAAYKALHEFNIDKASSQYKGGFNQILNESQVFTYKDTAIVTPNSDTPYSMMQLDLRAEPMVVCVPAVPRERYYSVQFADMYSFNYAYIGSRATGNEAGCYLIAGPGWTGSEAPAGIRQVFRNETQFGLVIFRTQLFGPDDIDNVRAVQAGYTAQPLSAFLGQPAPPAPPAVDWLAFSDEAFKTEFPRYLDFLLQFAPEVAAEKELRARFASVGIGPGRSFEFKDLSAEHKAEIGLGIKEGFAAIEDKLKTVGTEVNGWAIAAVAGDRAFYNGDFLLRAVAAKAGIYANDAVEATYPMARSDSKGEPLDGSKHSYTITFKDGEFPPVNAFWSVTMYDGKTQLLIENPINRYLINSPMLPGMKKNADGSLTLRVSHESPGKDLESNWLPAPDGPIYMVMRLYWPKTEAPSVLPPGQGSWQPPAIVPDA
ncbi:MAG TPA: DUF1254 domain-containing protein [Pseudomonadota bacterium]|nr:DUF1254 domain-containing protein [Pseudomonadota bacterium]